MNRLAWIALLAIACKSDDTDVLVDDTDVLDTDVVDTDTDTEPVDTSEPPIDRITIEVRADVAGQPGWRVAAVLADVEGGVTERREVVSVDGSTLPAQVVIDPPVGDDITEISTGTTGALYFWVIYADGDGDGARDADEPIVATSEEVLAWIEDGESFDRIWIGLGLDLDGGGATSFFDAFEGFDLTGFVERDTVTFGGTSTAVPPPDRLALVSAPEIEGGTTIGARPYDEAWAGEPWEVTVSGELDPARLYDPGFGSLVGVEIPLATMDTDRDGAYSADDLVVGIACYEGLTAGLFYLPEPTTLYSALTALATGYATGWNLVAFGADGEMPQPIPDDQAGSLVLSDCGS